MDNNSNMLQLCRLCLVKDDVNIPIFEEQGDIRQIFLKISSCLPVKVSRDDRLPKKICDGCSYKLDMLYEFWNTSANAEKQLLTWLGEAGMTSQMADGTISAVAQQIKPADAFVKQETIDPPDISMDDEDDEEKEYMKQEENSNNIEEPPPKRARRTAAVKAAIALDQNSDDDDDSGEPMTKIEDDSEDSDIDDREPAFVDVPSTSADDQPGPSGVGKEGVEAPIYNRQLRKTRTKFNSEFLSKKDGFTKKLRIILQKCDSKPVQKRQNTSLHDVKISYRCYECMALFQDRNELEKHKLSESNKKKSVGFRCAVCDVDFCTVDDVKKHQKNNCKFKCEPCELSYNTTGGLIVHMLRHKLNTSVSKKYICNDCSSTFSDIIQLKSHTLLAHKLVRDKDKPGDSVDKEDLSCDICYDVFVSKKQLDEHLDFHKELARNNVSSICFTELSDDSDETILMQNDVDSLVMLPNNEIDENSETQI